MLNVESLKHNIFAFTNAKTATLSDRLKQAGIKEMKPPKQLKKGKKEKPDPKKYIYSKDYLDNNCRNISEIKKKDENQSPDDILLVSGKSSQSEEPRIVEKNIEEVKETVLVSMDFIEDVQKYKKKVRSPKDSWELKYEAYIKDECSNSKITSPKKKEVIKQHDNNIKKSIFDEGKSETEEYSENEKNADKENLSKQANNKRKSQTENEAATNSQLVQPFLNKISSDDTAKIDQSYIQSLLTLAMYREKDQKNDTNSKKSEESIANEEQSEKKARTSGKTFFTRKIKRKKTEAEDDSKKPAEEPKTASESSKTEDSTFHKEPTTLHVRDFTKSEEIKKENSLDCKGKPKTLNVTHSKPAVVTTRRKRKFRHNYLKKSDKEFIETSFPGENLRAADVKELWRRESAEKSENSLSSHSSCTVPESDESPDWKNLGLDSYKILKKLVEEEVKKISKKSENKDNKENVKNQTNNSSLNEALKVKNCLKTLTEDTNTERTKKPVPEIIDSMKKKELLRRFAEDIPKEPDLKIKSVEEKTKTKTKIPRKVIQDWNILNRLEQAFVALGTPNFPTKTSKDANNTKVKKSSPQTSSKNDSSAQKAHPDHLKEGKKLTKKKEPLAKKGKKDLKIRQISSNTKTGKETPEKSTRKTNQQITKIDINNKISVLRERLQGNTSKKEPERKLTQRTPTTKYKETNLQQKKVKLQEQSNPPKVSCKPFRTTTTTSTIKQETMPSSSKFDHSRNHFLPAKIKLNQRYTTNPKTLEETFERKITSNIISGEVDRIPLLRSESFIKESNNKNHSLEMENQDDQIIEIFGLDYKNNKLSETEYLTKREEGNETETETEIKEEMKRETEIKEEIKTETEIKEDVRTETEIKEEIKTETEIKEDMKTETEIKEEMKTETEIKEDMKTETEIKEEMETETTSNKEEIKENITSLPVYSIEYTLPIATKEPEEKISGNLISEPDLISESLYSCKNDSNKTIEELLQPEQLPVKKELKSNSTEKVLKKRSILSVQTSPSLRLRQMIQEKDNPDDNDFNIDLCKKITQNDLRTFYEICRRSYSNTSVSSTGTIDLNDIEKNVTNSLQDKKFEFSRTLTESSLSSCTFEEHPVDHDRREYNTTKKKTSWEKDIKFYHAIVTDILSQYNRINGFLKQNGYLNSLNAASSLSNEKKSHFDDPQVKNNLLEYRKKIIMEYKALPILEYKIIERSQREDIKKKTLAVVKDLERDIDLDVKDYEVQADLQLKQQDSLFHSKGNRREKNISLQEIMLCGGENSEKEEKQLRSCSTTKAFLPLQGLDSVKNLPSKESMTNLSLSVTTWYPETESESR